MFKKKKEQHNIYKYQLGKPLSINVIASFMSYGC